jgi:hypothetical protein
MGDMGDMYRDHKEYVKEQKELYGQPCGGCVQDYPNRNPSVLFPNQKCRWCGWVDPRERQTGVHK